jgi:multidrug efflux pump subunit AcrA (membrane-fusion protein)
MVRSHLATAQALAQAEKSAADARAALSALDAQGADGPRTLTAPYRAIVTAIGTSVGAIVSQGSGLLDLARPTGLVLEAGVVAARAGAVRPGEEAKVTALGARDGARGRVVARGSLVDPASGLVPVEIALPAGRFLPGERAEAAITVGVERGYVVPHEAILVDDSGNPYVVEALDGVAKKVGVRVVAAEGDKNVVRGPLDAGALLVLSGNYQLRDGMRVRVAGTPQKTGK